MVVTEISIIHHVALVLIFLWMLSSLSWSHPIVYVASLIYLYQVCVMIENPVLIVLIILRYWLNFELISEEVLVIVLENRSLIISGLYVWKRKKSFLKSFGNSDRWLFRLHILFRKVCVSKIIWPNLEIENYMHVNCKMIGPLYEACDYLWHAFGEENWAYCRSKMAISISAFGGLLAFR